MDAITVIGADFNALQPILQQAMSQGIAVNSVDTAVNPDSRQVHVEQCSIDEVGRAQDAVGSCESAEDLAAQER